MKTLLAQRLGLGALNALALLVAAYAFLAYALWPPGHMVGEKMQAAFSAHPVLIYGHVFAAALALALGPWQFSSRLRRARPQVHRWIGRTYLGVGVLVGGVFGLLLSRFAQGGAVGQIGFALLAVVWLYTGLRGWLAIRAGSVAEHRQWMLRNQALTLAAVSLRIYVSLALATPWPFEPLYAAIAWLCWVPNLLLAEWWLRRAAGQAWVSTMHR
ncbi:MAG: DUF2306 domain-containing protein [Cytophagales bacterium]|nr:DUF2306 domain-containing protein [Rhizobacter sp.]